MDAISTIIITAFINIVISSIVSILIFSRFQKNIELSFSKKLEEYKANLQYSNFEQQTKFVRIHEKEVDVVETVYRKFYTFTQGFIDLPKGAYTHNEHKIDFHQYESNTQLLDDCVKYLHANTLYLPHDIKDNIYEIFRDAQALDFMISLLFNNATLLTFQHLEQANSYMKRFPNMTKLDTKEPDFSTLIFQMMKQAHGQTITLEAIYKAVTDTPLFSNATKR